MPPVDDPQWAALGRELERLTRRVGMTDERVTQHLAPAAIDELINPVGYIGLCADMAREAAARARAAA